MTADLSAYTTKANTSADFLALERSLCNPHSLSYAGGRLVLPQGAHGGATTRRMGQQSHGNHMPVDTGVSCLARGTQADVLVQEWCRCCVCSVRSNRG
jgi:hypothetical protein